MDERTAKTNSVSPLGAETRELMQEYSLLMNVPAGVAVLEGPDHVFRLANDSYAHLVNDRELIGREVREAFPELDGQGFYELLDSVYRDQKPFVGRETPAILHDGVTGQDQTIYVDLTYNPIVGSNGETRGIFVHAVDVTEAVANRQAIDEARKRYKMVLSSVDEGFCLIDVMFDDAGNPYDYLFVEANANFEEQTGLKDAVGKTARELVPGLEQSWFDLYGGVAKTGKSSRFSQGSDIMGRWFDVQATKVAGGSDTLVALLFKDVSIEHKAELELKRIERRYEALFNSNTVALAVATMDGKVVEANGNFLSLFGFTKKDLKDGIDSTRLDAASDTNRELVYDNLRAHGESLPLERRYVKKDGTEFPALVGYVKLPGDDDKFVSFVIDRSETEQLKELNRTKDEFIALASHQLRSPATAVKQYLGIVTDEYAGPITADQLQYLTIASNANDRQLMIIEDLLKTARIDTRGFNLTMTPGDLGALVRDAVRQYTPILQTKNQTLSLEVPADVFVPMDKVEINIVVANLIENASKYSESGSTIYVTITKQPTYAEISVRDTGVGIAKKDLDKVFEKFTRVHNELSDTASGSGLGLYWVKRIIDIHKGSLTIESELGKGTTFTVRLKR